MGLAATPQGPVRGLAINFDLTTAVYHSLTGERCKITIYYRRGRTACTEKRRRDIRPPTDSKECDQ